MFRTKPNKREKAIVIQLYRNILRVIKRLQPSHQKLWYDYTKLKFEENAVKRPEEVKKIVSAAYEELEWVQSVLSRKEQGKP